MLRLFCNALRGTSLQTTKAFIARQPRLILPNYIQNHNFSSLYFRSNAVSLAPKIICQPNLLEKSLLSQKIQDPLNVATRTVTKFSLRKGKRRSVKAVIKRFFRLHWGGWIRTRAGRHKKLWKKSPPLQRRLRQHVFCNATQSQLLDKMVTSFWRKPKYYVDDPYAPYHTREEFSITRKKPLGK